MKLASLQFSGEVRDRLQGPSSYITLWNLSFCLDGCRPQSPHHDVLVQTQQFRDFFDGNPYSLFGLHVGNPAPVYLPEERSVLLRKWYREFYRKWVFTNATS
jgi:hypothetical protein